MREMHPWYRGFKGAITPADTPLKYDVHGVVEKKDSTTLEITELPIRKWTQDFKEFLEDLLTGGQAEGRAKKEGEEKGDKDKGRQLIEDYKEYHTENSVHFVLTLTEEN